MSFFSWLRNRWQRSSEGGKPHQHSSTTTTLPGCPPRQGLLQRAVRLYGANQERGKGDSLVGEVWER